MAQQADDNLGAKSNKLLICPGHIWLLKENFEYCFNVIWLSPDSKDHTKSSSPKILKSGTEKYLQWLKILYILIVLYTVFSLDHLELLFKKSKTSV